MQKLANFKSFGFGKLYLQAGKWLLKQILTGKNCYRMNNIMFVGKAAQKRLFQARYCIIRKQEYITALVVRLPYFILSKNTIQGVAGRVLMRLFIPIQFDI
ncbi:hypothetical protein KY46_00575 [Photobacterium halotolerans]|uniref:Uncharacterized protein n=1 Tax=Photobacterium halotolerans TaxID=265726 RepID=A0A0F5VH25_9GAMM|nr:hypothetical protein KY46_00575 [Photobacterium halotolerans]